MAPDGPMPVVTAYDSDVAEAEGVAALLADRSAEGVHWAAQAVLARTHEQLSVVRQALARAGIPHRMAPGPERRHRPKAGIGRTGGVDAVELATFHRAKGLEWTSVCVVGLEDGFVPIIYAESDDGPGRRTTPALCRPDPCLPGPALLVVTDPAHGPRPGRGAAAVAVVGGGGTGVEDRPGPDDATRSPAAASPRSGPDWAT